jgi:hypothetical protein
MLEAFRRVLAVALAIGWGSAQASDERLLFRADGTGQTVAVLSGMTGFCNQVPVSGVNGISITGYAITINSFSLGTVGGCPVPVPPSQRYEVVAPLGFLPEGAYSVAWTVTFGGPGGPTSTLVSGTLFVGAPDAPGVPTMSSLALVMLAVLVMLGAGARLERK